MVNEKDAAELYRRYGPALYRRCLTLVSHEEDARELVQETFFQFWRGRNRFEGRSSAFTFLYRIATNLSIDRLRRRKTAGDQSELDEERHEGREGGPDRRSSALSELAALTEGLDAETMTIAVMSHVDGLTQDEIAEALGLSRRTIGKKLKRFASHTGERVTALREVLAET
ncbi:MAG: sigma-70 family RNA polymerase sigma factor [Myxococcota bacterium]